jgi:transposase
MWYNEPMKAYSEDLRERVVRAVAQGKSRKEIVSLFGVSLSTLKRYLKQDRETGSLKPKAIPGRPAKKAACLHMGIVAQLEANPDATLERHCELWEHTHGVRVSPRTMGRAITAVGWTRKKSPWPPANATRKNEPVGVSRGVSCPPKDWSFWMNVAPTSH